MGGLAKPSFIHEDGSFKINFDIGHLGKAKIADVLIKSMMDSSTLSYKLYSDSQSITYFYKQLKNYSKLISYQSKKC